jgi:hypothetical protein
MLDNKEDNRKLAGSGNASNPSPYNKEMEPANGNQLLNEKAEKYLRESGNIEDEPDAQDQQDADEILRKQSKS